MMNNDFEPQLQEIVQKIVRNFHPEKIILFGSWAWSTHLEEDSDVDIVIIKDTGNTREEARRMDQSLFPRPFLIALIVYRPDQIEKRRTLGDSFVKIVMEKGQVLYAA
ncbi:MAG: nucleotidyltransferase domain-containing protein [Candidatus Omnitrophica bacterium]|nr:nucleotidyltransferase domain-containing protein [Candidatus Omnitrophota bacterium]